MTESLIQDGHEVHGIIRRRSPLDYIKHLVGGRERLPWLRDLGTLTLHLGDVTDSSSLASIVKEVRPDLIYHLAAMSFVGVAWQIPVHTVEVTGLGVLYMLEAFRQHAPEARFYQAGTTEQFGASAPPQNETTPFYPRSPYGCAKVLGFNLVRNFRESYGLFAVTGILGNHESPRRGSEFVTRKISQAVARVHVGKQRKVQLGDLKAERDWGFAREYVEAMRLMLERPTTPRDYVVGTGVSHSVEDFAREAFKVVGRDWREHVEVDPKLVRLAEVRQLRADASAIRRDLGWEPRVEFKDLVKEMVEADLEREQK